MNQLQAGKLLDKYLQGKANAQEEAIVQSWLMRQTSANEKANVRDEYALPPAMWDAVYQSIHVKRTRLWPRMITVAAAIAAIVFGVWFYKYKGEVVHGTLEDKNVVGNDVSPGKNGATLTLANGKKIRLSDVLNGQVTKEAGVTITKTADGRLIYTLSSAPSLRGGTTKQSHTYNTLTTANGETYQVKLPDGTEVWLNAASSMQYAANFDGLMERKVKLTGEAYFIVKHNARQPFRVISRGQVVEDIGTEFNVNSYPNEPEIKTTLVEGLAKVTTTSLLRDEAHETRSGQAKQSHLLSPGQQTKLSNGVLKVVSADIEETMAWKKGEIFFNGRDIQTIMRTLSRWYDIEVSYEGEVSNELYYVKISRYGNISEILTLLEKTGDIHFKIEGRKVIVTK